MPRKVNFFCKSIKITFSDEDASAKRGNYCLKGGEEREKGKKKKWIFLRIPKRFMFTHSTTKFIII